MDGVLADTHPLVIDAYHAAGIDMPTWAWGQPWHTWLPEVAGGNTAAMTAHSRKTTAYLEMLSSRAAEVELPAAGVVRKLVERAPGYVWTVTSAANASAVALLTALRIPINVLCGSSLYLADRSRLIRTYATGHSCVYFDDMALNGDRVAADSPGTKFHLVTTDTTTQEIEDAIRWTR